MNLGSVQIRINDRGIYGKSYVRQTHENWRKIKDESYFLILPCFGVGYGTTCEFQSK